MGSLTSLRCISTILRIRIAEADEVFVERGGLDDSKQYRKIVSKDVSTIILHRGPWRSQRARTLWYRVQGVNNAIAVGDVLLVVRNERADARGI